MWSKACRPRASSRVSIDLFMSFASDSGAPVPRGQERKTDTRAEGKGPLAARRHAWVFRATKLIPRTAATAHEMVAGMSAFSALIVNNRGNGTATLAVGNLSSPAPANRPRSNHYRDQRSP